MTTSRPVRRSAPAEAGAARDPRPGDQPGEPAPAKKKGKLLAVVLVGVLALGGAGFKLMGGTGKGAKGHPATTAPAAGPIDSLDAVTINLADGHLLQVGVALQLTTAAKADKVNQNSPEILDAVISVFSAWSYPALLGPGAHNQARAQLLAKIQSLFPPNGGQPQVSGVYFTTFVMQ